uniref:Uncharacterized protein n=2 Tax=Acrobeloides nanus TaxID=290746 RepID=A0A914CUM2_9BILA
MGKAQIKMRAVVLIIALIFVASFVEHKAEARALRRARLAHGENCTWTEKTMKFQNGKRCYVYNGDKNMCVNKGNNDEDECSPSYIKSCNKVVCEENYGI